MGRLRLRLRKTPRKSGSQRRGSLQGLVGVSRMWAPVVMRDMLAQLPRWEGSWLSPSALRGHLIIKLDKGR